MQSEKFDIKIRQAAEQHHPDYDSKAWAKMEKLLDRHLPQKEDRRRRVLFFLLMFMLLGGGAWMIISKPWTPADQTLTTAKTQEKKESGQAPGSAVEKQATTSPADQPATKTSISPVTGTERNNDPVVPEADGLSTQTPNEPVLTKVKPAKRSDGQKQLMTPGNNPELLAVEVTGPGSEKKGVKQLPSNSQDASIVADPFRQVSGEISKNNNPVEQPAKEDKSVAKDNQKVKETPAEKAAQPADPKKQAPGTRKRNNFFLSLSVAPDISSVEFRTKGESKLLTGFGLGYTFKDRLTLSTGFYAGHKVYTAEPGDYKPSVTPPGYMYVSNIDADCKVYEIPVNVAYNFGLQKNHNFFAGVGASSLIMKKEEYVYLYKYPNGTTYTHTKTVDNEYKHLFSELTLTAGYQQRLSKTFSVSAAPYVKLPLSGVGYGKVRLSSAGVMVSLNVSPFHHAPIK